MTTIWANYDEEFPLLTLSHPCHHPAAPAWRRTGWVKPGEPVGFLCGGAPPLVDIIGGKAIKRTNKETLDWLKSSADKTREALLAEAKVFFGNFDGQHQKLASWKSKILAENKSKKQKAHRTLMKECGGEGKQGENPPKTYVPDWFLTGNMCQMCKTNFNGNNELREHARSFHTVHVKQWWSKDSLANVHMYQEYKDWLDEETEFYRDENKAARKEEAELEKTNNEMRERSQDLMKNESFLVKVVQKGNIIETKRPVLALQENGTISKKVVVEQYANITKRKTNEKENQNENELPPKKRMRHQSQALNEILDHMSGGNVERKSIILANVIDTQGAEVATGVSKQSKEIKVTQKFTSDKTAALISGANLSDYQAKQLRTACNNELGANPFASAHKVTQARQNILPINRDDWEINYQDLYRNKCGKNADKKKRTCVKNVRNLKDYIQKMANSEKENLENLKEGDNLNVCWNGDGGGGRFISSFAFTNNKDRKIKLHPFLIFEGTDVRANLEVTLGRLTQQFKELEDSKIKVDGKTLTISQFGVFDLCALNCILGKQNHSSTFFDAWTDCTTEHIRNHSGRSHTPALCAKEIHFLSLKKLEEHLTNHSLESIPNRKTGNQYGNVVGENLLPLKDIFRYITPLMHTIMGLGNDTFNDLKTNVIELDNTETETEHNNKDIVEELKTLYKEKESLSVKHGNNALDKYIAENDLQKLPHLLKNNETEAEKLAKSRYSKSRAKAKKNNCDTGLCVIFPCDEENSFAELMTCHNGCKVHARCEGIVYVPFDYVVDEAYICKTCRLGEGGREWLEKAIEDGITQIKNFEIMRRLTEIKMRIEKLENEDSKCGKRQTKLKESLKKLKIDPAIYHGGDFEGKAIQKMLDCSRNEEFELLHCVSDKEELHSKFKRALTTLQEVSDLFKSKIEHFDDQQIEAVKKICEKWGENWPIDFPHKNITPKGHNLVWVLPEVLRIYKQFYMFYKVEEKGESIHAELNKIQRRIWCIRDPAERLWKYIEQYELKNVLDTDIVTPLKRVLKNKTT